MSPLSVESVDLRLDFGTGRDVRSPVNSGGDGLDFVPQSHVVVVDVTMLAPVVLNQLEYGLGQHLSTGTTLRPVPRNNGPPAKTGDFCFDQRQFRRGISREVIDADHAR